MGMFTKRSREDVLRQTSYVDRTDTGRKVRDAERQALLIRQNDILIEEAQETNRLLRLLVDRG